ncbi:hypothetical protein T484DRAFT_1811565 [Baffinella frigidus]|nr:hypothetical protein T484DRAFT_1811565 [Cryptophyta sp. CCMP2293]
MGPPHLSPSDLRDTTLDTSGSPSSAGSRSRADDARSRTSQDWSDRGGWRAGEARPEARASDAGREMERTPGDLEEAARRVSATCRMAVWRAWRGDPSGLDPLYSVSLHEHACALLVECGLVDVLVSLLRFALDICQPSASPPGAMRPNNNRRDSANPSRVVEEAPAASLAGRVLAILVNLAMSPLGERRCLACAPLKSEAARAFATLDRAVQGDAGRLAFVLDGALRGGPGAALAAAAARARVAGLGGRWGGEGGVVYVTGSPQDEDVTGAIRKALAKEGVSAPRGEGGGAEGYGDAVGRMVAAVGGCDLVLLVLSEAFAKSHRSVLVARFVLNVQCPVVVVLPDAHFPGASLGGGGAGGEARSLRNMREMMRGGEEEHGGGAGENGSKGGTDEGWVQALLQAAVKQVRVPKGGGASGAPGVVERCVAASKETLAACGLGASGTKWIKIPGGSAAPPARPRSAVSGSRAPAGTLSVRSRDASDIYARPSRRVDMYSGQAGDMTASLLRDRAPASVSAARLRARPQSASAADASRTAQKDS